MALLRRGKKHAKRRPEVKTHAITLSQVMSCPNRILHASHWMGVGAGELCECARTEVERISNVDDR